MSSLQNYLTNEMFAEDASEEVQATPDVQPQQQQQPVPEPTVREVADATDKEELEAGYSTRAGQVLEAIDPRNLGNNVAAGLNAITPEDSPLKPLTQAVDDFVMSQQELQEQGLRGIQDADERGDVVTREILATGQGIVGGLNAAAMMPVSVAARIESAVRPGYGRDDWSEPPAELKDTATGELAFEITRIVAPTLLGLGPQALATRTAVEAAVETIPQRSAEDLILGREGAIKAGEIVELMGGDGKQLTQDLIEGRKPSAQAINMVGAYLQNWGINIGAELLFGRIGAMLNRGQVDESIQQVASITGKSSDEVAASIDNVSLPNKGKDYDINEAIEIDTGVPLPNEGKFINSDALLTSAVRRIDPPSLGGVSTSKPPSYSTTLDNIVSEKTMRESLDEAVKVIERLPSASREMAQIRQTAKAWLDEFIDTTSGRLDLDRALVSYPFADEMVESTGKGAAVFANRGSDEFLRESAINTPSGAIAASVIGEELSERLARQASQIMNLEDQAIPWEAAIERYIQLQDKSNLFLMPFRRFQRRFHIGGESLQQQTKEKVLSSMGVKDAKTPKVTRAEASPSRDFNLIRNTPDDEGRTIRELLDAYKGGDKDAGNTLKTYFAVLANSNPKTSIAMMDNLQDVMLRALRSGNTDASKKMLYAGYLTRISPIQASVFSNLFNLLKEPLGIAMSRGKGNRLYAAGELLGGFNVLGDALSVAKKAFDKGGSINGATGTKLDIRIKESKAAQAEIEKYWAGAQKELTAKGAGKAEWFLRWIDYQYQMIAAAPLNGLAGRLFIGADEFSNVLYGGMVAGGRAMREAGEKGFKGGIKELKDISNKHLNEVFIDGVKNGVLNPLSGVDKGSSRLTFSRPIPRNGNNIDKAFVALSDAAQDSKFFTWVSPFTRASWNLMEQGGIMMASSLPIPSRRVKEWMLGSLIPRYRATLNGDYGEVAMLQLKSDISFAHFTSIGVGMAAWEGRITGRNPDEGLPEQSFIIPTDNKQGYVAVPYGRLEPFATYLSVIADSVKAFRDDLITEQDFTAFAGNVAQATGLATIDKSFLQGMSTISEILTVVRTPNEGKIVRAGQTVAGIATATQFGSAAALTRMIADWTNPYQTLPNADPSRDFPRAMWSNFASRHLGGHTNPIRYDPLTGEPEVKVGGLQGKERWVGILKGLVNETFVPGKVKSGTNRDIYEALEVIGYDTKNFYSGVRTANGVPLSLEQQSVLLQDLHDYGDLSGRLRAEFEKPKVQTLIKDLRRSRNDTSEEGRFRTERLEAELTGLVTSAYADAKQRAVSVGRLSKDEKFVASQIAKNNSNQPAQQKAQQSAAQQDRFSKVLGIYK